jgi:hypothetical protein
VLEVAKSELSKKNIDVTMNLNDGVPPLVKGDSYKFKQVLLNLLHQSLAGTYKGFFKIIAGMSYIQNIPYINIDVESSQSAAHKAEAEEINNLAEETNFKRMLESKVDINLKIAKILSNAMGWSLTHNSSKGSKFSIGIPLSHTEVAPQDF